MNTNKTNKEMTDFIVHKSMKKLKIAQAIKRIQWHFVILLMLDQRLHKLSLSQMKEYKKLHNLKNVP